MRPDRSPLKSCVLRPVLLALVAGSLSEGLALAAGPSASGSRGQRPVVSEQPGDPAELRRFQPPGPLPAEHRALIQLSGQTVLSAKHSARPDPAAQATGQELKAVSTELMRVFRDSSLARPVLQTAVQKRAISGRSEGARAPAIAPAPARRLIPGDEPNRFVEAPLEPSAAAGQPETAIEATAAEPVRDSAGWRGDFGGLQAQVTRARDALPAVAARRSQAEATASTLAAEKGANTLAALQAALDAQDPAQLAALRERLKPRTLPEERERLRRLAGLPVQTTSSPTLTTQTRHR